MTLSSEVEAALGDMSEQLKTLEGDLSAGLSALDQNLNGPLGNQWNITYVVSYGSDWEEKHEVRVPVAQIYSWYGNLEFAKNWRPEKWMHLGQILPYANPDARIYEWTYGENPDAAQARQKFNDTLPQFRATNEGAVRDITDLIELPRKLGSFYTQWESARDRMDSVPGLIDQALQLDRTRVTWSGAGHDAYRAVAEKQRAVSDAVRSGISGLLDDVLGYADLSVDVVNTLKSAADTLKSGLIQAGRDLMSVLENPKDWLRIVNLLINAFESGDKLRSDAAIAGVNSLTSIIQRQATIDNHFSELQAATAASSPSGISWPEPTTDMNFTWEPTMAR